MKDQYISSKVELGRNLRLIREKLALTQKQLADALGLDRSTYSYYEVGKVTPDIFTLIKLSKILRCDIYSFITSGLEHQDL